MNTMDGCRRRRAAVSGLLAVVTFLASSWSIASPADRFAWAENAGWLNAEPVLPPPFPGGWGIQVGDAELTGWMWGENVGWVSLSCKNTLSCARVSYGVANNGSGVLSGFAWGENVGWINFRPSTAGVVIDPATGIFSGYAWGENIGWISFNCSNTGTCAQSDFKVARPWICSPAPPAPSARPALRVTKSGADGLLTWDRVSGATGADVVRGTLSALVSSGGSFVIATDVCLASKTTAVSLLDGATPPAGDGWWYLVRAQNCGGTGSYDSQGASQVGSRDAEIVASGRDCP